MNNERKICIWMFLFACFVLGPFAQYDELAGKYAAATTANTPLISAEMGDADFDATGDFIIPIIIDNSSTTAAAKVYSVKFKGDEITPGHDATETKSFIVMPGKSKIYNFGWRDRVPGDQSIFHNYIASLNNGPQSYILTILFLDPLLNSHTYIAKLKIENGKFVILDENSI